LGIREYLAEMFATSPEPGPIGHGFTEENLLDGTTWWSRPEGPQVQLIGLDTTNHTAGSEGRLGPRQMAWLEQELAAHSSAHGGTDRLVIVFSHHNSSTMTNTVEDPTDPGPAIGGEQLLELLGRFPNVVLWVNGHSHANEILAHPRPGGDGAGLWEINTASCIDFGQQARTIEVLDNGDGTLSVLTTSIDHAAPPSVAARADGCYSPEDLASISRELAANDARWIDPWEQLGRPEDRNTELALRAPTWLAG
jgi:metallophosphoesterase (TIGR03767 family)